MNDEGWIIDDFEMLGTALEEAEITDDKDTAH